MEKLINVYKDECRVIGLGPVCRYETTFPQTLLHRKKTLPYISPVITPR